MLAMVKSGVGLSLCRESIALHEKQVSGLVVHDDLMVSTELSFLMCPPKGRTPNEMHIERHSACVGHPMKFTPGQMFEVQTTIFLH